LETGREPFYSVSLMVGMVSRLVTTGFYFFVKSNNEIKRAARAFKAHRPRPLNRFKIHRRPKSRRRSTVEEQHRRRTALESNPKFIMPCANVQNADNICAPCRFTNIGTHRALSRSIDITPLAQTARSASLVNEA